MPRRSTIAFPTLSSPKACMDNITKKIETYSINDLPPLDSNGDIIVGENRRQVNIRWLAGSILTALGGAALIGGATIIALQGDIEELSRPQRAFTPQGTNRELQSSAYKTDSLVRKEIAGKAVRQEFKAPVTVRVGEREAIKTRDFVRITAPLSLTVGTYARAIPPFNPLKLFAESSHGQVTSHEVDPDATDIDVSVIKRPLIETFFSQESPALNAEEALAQIIAEKRLLQNTSHNNARLMLRYSLRHPLETHLPEKYTSIVDTAFSDIDVRFVPENVTFLPKNASDLPSAINVRSTEERMIGKAGDSILKILIDEGAHIDDARAIIAALQLKEHDKLRKGQNLSLLPVVAPFTNPGKKLPLDSPIIGRITLWKDNLTRATAAITDDGKYVPVSIPRAEMQTAERKNRQAGRSDSSDGPGAPLYESLYETAGRYDFPPELIKELIPIFASDVDFQHRVRNGESIELLYTKAENNQKPELLYASFTVDGETKRLFRFQPTGKGEIAFYDNEGRSLQKFLLRKPIAGGRLTSGFGMRYHPIMHYAKMHTGVDWADRIGTPILAAGDGIVIKAKWDSGYGRRIEIQHTNGYISTYSHQSNFARGIKPGIRVRQGQVIGYLGNSGLSTGPHLHYEVKVNGHFVDPMKIKLPRSSELRGAELAEFSRQRDQTQDLLAKAGSSSQAATP